MASVHFKSRSLTWFSRPAKNLASKPPTSATQTRTRLQSSNPSLQTNLICHIHHRHKYQSWPSEEHAAFAFARLATPGHTTIGPQEFISVLKKMQLNYNLGDAELLRVFDAMDTNGDGRLSIDEFKNGRGEHPFTKTLVETLSGACNLYSAEKFKNDEFDSGRSTAEFYGVSLEHGFYGENVNIRKILDYTYHCNYVEERQYFQDALIQSNLLVGSGSDEPWHVLTCGPMGAGKGWILGWMSATGILQLERVSKIDPDAFKLKMPEWKIYQENNMANVAGSMTHAESSYVAEIAQHVAMRNSMDVWIDGSLRNYQWYEKELQRIRKRHPQYRIAIIVISAPDEMIDDNIKRRAEATGRDIPAELRQASSVKEINHGVAKLTHLADLVASVYNSPPAGENAVSEPVLQFVSMVDRSGNWDLIRELTSKRY